MMSLKTSILTVVAQLQYPDGRGGLVDVSNWPEVAVVVQRHLKIPNSRFLPIAKLQKNIWNLPKGYRVLSKRKPTVSISPFLTSKRHHGVSATGWGVGLVT